MNWLGELPDMHAIVGQADVVVLPSYHKGIPRALLEVAAMGKAPITTDAVGYREVVRERLGTAGRAKMPCEFDEWIVGRKTLQVYQQGRL